MKRVLVACGNGIATSTVVAQKVREACEEKGLSILVSQCKLLELSGKANDFDLVITTGKFTGDGVTVPIIGAISLLTGVGEDETIEKIIQILQ
ncbi:PTS system, galactitol-specific IIB component [Propionispira arboris]|uniref:PTS system, galactitol-specific IIB component n=1 Tax=Propionispira arboris TaxID=84035 RepID=A0A1H7AFC4_9FIRM|nr:MULTISPECIES: PTS sugar transporter subunit IIB [Propionispira]SEJ64331.1 PTS system, galactitol-specific IIB component [Propionispira arboris]